MLPIYISQMETYPPREGKDTQRFRKLAKHIKLVKSSTRLSNWGGGEHVRRGGKSLVELQVSLCSIWGGWTCVHCFPENISHLTSYQNWGQKEWVFVASAVANKIDNWNWSIWKDNEVTVPHKTECCVSLFGGSCAFLVVKDKICSRRG